MYFSRLRASSSCRACGLGRRPCAVCAPLCAFSSSEALTEPSSFSALEALAVGFGLARLRRGGDELLLRGFHREPVIGVVEHGEHVAFAHRLADVDLALDDLAADAERLVDFVARLHGADVAVRLPRLVVADLGRAHGRSGSAAGLSGSSRQQRGDRQRR